MKTRTKRLFSVLIAALMLLTLLPLTASAAEFDGGDGSVENPYLISTKAQLEEFRNRVNGGQTGICAKLTADIDLQGSENNQWTPIGINNVDENDPIWDSSTHYQGVFNGNGHIITGLYINKPGGFIQGFFASIENGTVKNLGIFGTIKGSEVIGGIFGYATTATIQNCFFSGMVEANWQVGGIGGLALSNCSISDSWFAGTVKGQQRVGGIVGDNWFSSVVSNCYSIGTVNGNEKVGAIAGDNNPDYTSGKVTNCSYLSGTATTGIGNGSGDATEKTKAEFEDGTVLNLLINGRTDHPWKSECKPVSGSALKKQPVLKWQKTYFSFDRDSDPKAGEMTVSHSEAVSYIVTIPEKVTAEQDFNITLSQVNPEPDYEVRVTLSGLTDNKLVLSRKGDENTKLTASVYKSSDTNTPLADGAVIAIADKQYLDENKLTETLKVGKPQAAGGTVKAGTYEGTVTFTVEYISKTITFYVHDGSPTGAILYTGRAEQGMTWSGFIYSRYNDSTKNPYIGRDENPLPLLYNNDEKFVIFISNSVYVCDWDTIHPNGHYFIIR